MKHALKAIAFQKLTQPQSLTLAPQHSTESLAKSKVPFFVQIALELVYKSYAQTNFFLFYEKLENSESHHAYYQDQEKGVCYFPFMEKQ